MTDYSRPDTGYGLVAVLEAYLEKLRASTGLAAVLEPVPVSTRECSIEVVPQAVKLVREEGDWEDVKRYRVELTHLVVLTGRGLGPLFVAEALQGSMVCGLAFDEPINIELGPSRFASVTLTPRGDTAGQFFESEEEGSSDHQYERVWEGTLCFPTALPSVHTSVSPDVAPLPVPSYTPEESVHPEAEPTPEPVVDDPGGIPVTVDA